MGVQRKFKVMESATANPRAPDTLPCYGYSTSSPGYRAFMSIRNQRFCSVQPLRTPTSKASNTLFQRQQRQFSSPQRCHLAEDAAQRVVRQQLLASGCPVNGDISLLFSHSVTSHLLHQQQLLQVRKIRRCCGACGCICCPLAVGCHCRWSRHKGSRWAWDCCCICGWLQLL